MMNNKEQLEFNYLEFLSISVPILKIKTANNLTSCFNLLDTNKKGYLTHE